MVSRRKKTFLAALTAEILIAIAIIVLLGHTPSPPESQAAPIIPEVPPILLVVPEAPFGTIAIALACFLALFIVLRRTRST
jgi:hypothetical protein